MDNVGKSDDTLFSNRLYILASSPSQLMEVSTKQLEHLTPVSIDALTKLSCRGTDMWTRVCSSAKLKPVALTESCLCEDHSPASRCLIKIAWKLGER